MSLSPFQRIAGYLVIRSELVVKIADLRADLITARNQAREDRITARRLLHEEQRRSQEYAATAVRLRAELDAERARNADLTAALRRLEVRRG
jgi:hypothetical protein